MILTMEATSGFYAKMLAMVQLVLLATFARGFTMPPQEIDSLKQFVKRTEGAARISAILDLAEMYQIVDLDSMSYYLKMAADELKQGQHILKARIHLLRGDLIYRKGNYDQALLQLDTARRLYKKSNHNRGIANVSNLQGTIHKHKGNLPLALKYSIQSLEIVLDEGDSTRIPVLYRSIGLLYREMKDFEQMLNYTKRALDYYDTPLLQHNRGGLLMNIGLTYRDLRQYTQALAYLHEALSVASKYNQLGLEALTRYNIGRLHSDRFEVAKGRKFLTEARQGFVKVGWEWGKIICDLQLSKCLLFEQKISLAESLALRSLRQALDLKMAKQTLEGYSLLSKIYYSQHDFEKGFQYKLSAQNFTDSLKHGEIDNWLSALRVQHELEIKESEILLGEHETAVLQTKKANLVLSRNLAIASIVFTLMIILWIINHYRYRNKTLKSTLALKNRELVSRSLQINENQKLINKLEADINKVLSNMAPELRQGLKSLAESLSENSESDKSWDTLKRHFDEVHPNFFKKLNAKFPKLTTNERKLCAYLRLDLSSKEISSLLNVTHRSAQVARYRLKKKMGLDESQDFIRFIQQI